MRAIAIIGLLLLASLPSASGALARQVASIGTAQTEPGAPGGTAPIDRPVGTEQTGGTMPETETAKMLVQLGALGVLIVVLFFYRRDFFTKNEKEREELERQLRERKEEKEQLAELVEKSNSVITNSAVTTARQTDATHRLARAVENIERRQAGLPPSAASSGSVV